MTQPRVIAALVFVGLCVWAIVALVAELEALRAKVGQ